MTDVTSAKLVKRKRTKFLLGILGVRLHVEWADGAGLVSDYVMVRLYGVFKPSQIFSSSDFGGQKKKNDSRGCFPFIPLRSERLPEESSRG